MGEPKLTQLQLRLTMAQKVAIRGAASRAGMDMSGWVLERLLPACRDQFQRIIGALGADEHDHAAYAAMNDWLVALHADEMALCLDAPDLSTLTAYSKNYLAAMVEQAASRKQIRPPDWTRGIKPLTTPRFASDLVSLRAHLLLNAPIPFRRRNIFVDSSIGDRV